MNPLEDYPDEWCLEALRDGTWKLWIHGTIDDALDEYYFHRTNKTFQRWRLTAPKRLTRQ
jgi:hypothetical protein